MSFCKQMITYPFRLILILTLLSVTLTNQALSSPSQTREVCNSTPYPNTCFDSLNLSVTSNIHDNLIQSLKFAISESLKLSSFLSNINNGIDIIENQKGTIEDCNQLHEITINSLNKSLTLVANTSAPIDKLKLADANAYLSAATTNKNTCQEGLESASGPLKPRLDATIIKVYKAVSNSLSLLSTASGLNQNSHVTKKGMTWLFREDDDYDDNEDGSNVLTVAADGSGNFTTITDAINFAPNNSIDRVIIYIKQGLYEENVEIPFYKPNITLLGEGRKTTVISGKRSYVDGWTTFRSATVAVSGDGFLARDIGFQNVAGPEKGQAVALRINADRAAVYKCTMFGYQDTLYAHSFRQFYRECDIYGTIDYICGNAAAVFQHCNIISMMPMSMLRHYTGQYTVISAQSRDSPDQHTGFSFQNCLVTATGYLRYISYVKSYLGRPWRRYSRTVFIESNIVGFIDPEGWIPWRSKDDQGLDTLYYGEYANYGPGSNVFGRVTWPGYHVMDYHEASKFAVSEFITGQEWLDYTTVPYDDGI